MKAFLAALAVGVLTLIVGASAATSAPSREHLIVGYSHAPTAADRAAIAGVGGKVRREFASISALAVDLPSGKASSIRSQSGVSYVETDGVRTPLSLSGTLPTTQLVPALDNGLYGLVTTHTIEAQVAGYKGAGVTACVADTGLDTNHPDLAFPKLVNTYDVFSDTAGLHATDVYALHVEKTETHATHVAGIVLGADNGLGIVGVAPGAKLEHARVLKTQEDGSVSGETSEVMAGVQWLAQHGCQVINMSLGGGDKSQAEEALYNQIRKNGTLIVVASGNDASKKVSFPGGYQSVLTVGAVDAKNQLASFSNTGAQMDVVAPGVDNLSSFPRTEGRDAFATVGGTTYPGLPMEFAGATPADGITGPLVNCKLGQTAADCGTHAPGFVALIQRGAVSFAQKVDSAMKAGAAAAIVFNNAANGPGNFNGTLGTVDDAGTPWIPAISLSQTDGEAIAQLPPGNATAFNVAMAWNYDSGTSMATPHVTGLAALILGKNPRLTPDQVETIIERNTTDLGVPNYDTKFGWGLMNSEAALAATP